MPRLSRRQGPAPWPDRPAYQRRTSQPGSHRATREGRGAPVLSSCRRSSCNNAARSALRSHGSLPLCGDPTACQRPIRAHETPARGEQRDSRATMSLPPNAEVRDTAGGVTTAIWQVEQQRGPSRKSLPGWTNLATPVTPTSVCCFSRLRKLCPTTMSDSATVERVVRVVRPGGVERSARGRRGRLLYGCWPRNLMSIRRGSQR